MKIIISTLLLLFLIACKKNNLPDSAPVITYQSFTKINNSTGIDNKGTINLKFEDANGNIGLDTKDTSGVYAYGKEFYYNFFVSYFEKINGSFVPVTMPVNNNGRIPYLQPESPKKVEGSISMDITINNPNTLADTVKFKIYIVDRALNKSNVIETEEIIIKN